MPRTKFQFLIGAMRHFWETRFRMVFKVSIPYRCNETQRDSGSKPAYFSFQFLIGAMRRSLSATDTSTF
uniref:Uncharacterized protein n=1 Tax=Kuenenia stuttgartiensis TaxID=174633 RepID=Q1Q4C4_KUEST|nr:unknown protein [Candidatus Kuenenia stuttgartiensis]